MNIKSAIAGSGCTHQSSGSAETREMFRMSQYCFGRLHGEIFVFVCAEKPSGVADAVSVEKQIAALLQLNFSQYYPDDDRPDYNQLRQLFKQLFADLVECVQTPQPVSVAMLYVYQGFAMAATLGDAALCLQCGNGSVFLSAGHTAQHLTDLVRLTAGFDVSLPDYDCRTGLFSNRVGHTASETRLTRCVGGSIFKWMIREPDIQTFELLDNAWAFFCNQHTLQLLQKAGSKMLPPVLSRNLISGLVRKGLNAQELIEEAGRTAKTPLSDLRGVTLAAFIRSWG